MKNDDLFRKGIDDLYSAADVRSDKARKKMPTNDKRYCIHKDCYKLYDIDNDHGDEKWKCDDCGLVWTKEGWDY